ncbi:MAG: alginate export family protein [Bradymonadia bacterium]
MRHLPVYCAAVAASLLCTEASAEVPIGGTNGWKVSAGALVRPRLFIDSGRDLVEGDFVEREYVTQRAQLSLSAQHNRGHRVFVQLQDVRQWGEENGPANFRAQGFGAHQAYAEIALPEDFSIRLGRQELVLDDHRLIGNLVWAQRGFSFSGATVRGKAGPVKLTALGFVISEDDVDPDGSADGTQPPAQLLGLHAHYPGGKAFSGSAMFLSRRTGGAADETRHTAGIFAKGSASGLSYQLDAYTQMGTLGEEDISAWLAAARVGYTLDMKYKPGITVWYEAVSGDGEATGAFDTLYATNHKFYGEMDFFLNIPRHTQNLGLVDVGGRLMLRAAKPWWLYVDVHNFSTMEENPNGDTALGTEINAALKWIVAPGLMMRTVYGIMLPEDGLRGAQDPDTEHMLFVTTSLSF